MGGTAAAEHRARGYSRSDSFMNPELPTPERIAQEFLQANEELDAARILSRRGTLNAAISSAYYACFHAARAVLYAEGVVPRTHKGVALEFGRTFVKSGRLSKKWSRILDTLRSERDLADYHAASRSITREAVADSVRSASQFVKRMEQLAKEGGGQHPE